MGLLHFQAQPRENGRSDETARTRRFDQAERGVIVFLQLSVSLLIIHVEMAVLMGSLARTVQFPPSVSPARFTNMASNPISIRNTASAVSSLAKPAPGSTGKLPVLLFDIMDTIVRDPFYEDIPAFFGYPSYDLSDAANER